MFKYAGTEIRIPKLALIRQKELGREPLDPSFDWLLGPRLTHKMAQEISRYAPLIALDINRQLKRLQLLPTKQTVTPFYSVSRELEFRFGSQCSDTTGCTRFGEPNYGVSNLGTLSIRSCNSSGLLPNHRCHCNRSSPYIFCITWLLSLNVADVLRRTAQRCLNNKLPQHLHLSCNTELWAFQSAPIRVSHVRSLSTRTPAAPSLLALHTPPSSPPNSSNFHTSTFSLHSSSASSPPFQAA